jgi:hypothetical protein
MAQESTPIDGGIMKGFLGADHLRRILEEVQTIVSDTLAESTLREKS